MQRAQASRGRQYDHSAAAAWDRGRINHRIDNKPFIADGARAFFGRNIADINFMKLETDDFIDIDVLAARDVPPTMQADFDRVTLPERAALSMRTTSAR